jgi:predicted RNase H-like nuclease (RuvC/YqgF family)
MTTTNPSKKSGADKRVMRNRRTLPSRQRTYRHLYARVDRLEDAISHFYDAINELRRRVSTLEKELKRGGGNTRH